MKLIFAGIFVIFLGICHGNDEEVVTRSYDETISKINEILNKNYVEIRDHDYNLGEFGPWIEWYLTNRTEAENLMKSDLSTVLLEISNQNIDTALKSLKLFGHLIARLKINYFQMSEEKAAQLNDYITNYCSESLIHIELHHVDEYRLVNLTGPFPNVECLQLRIGYLKKYPRQFNETFPSIRRLNLEEMNFLNDGCFEQHFPQLEYLSLKSDWPASENILRQNTHIKQLKLYGCTIDLVRMLSEHFTKLENLELNEFTNDLDTNGIEIRLDQLKSLKIDFVQDTNSSAEVPFLFGNLEEIEYAAEYFAVNQWVEIITRNNHLKKVTLAQANDEQIARIAENVALLEEFNVKRMERCDGGIVHVLRICTCLQKASFGSCKDKNANEVIREVMPNWSFSNGQFVRVH